MLVTQIIGRKRDQCELSRDEIQFMVDGIAGESIPDYQIAAWAMAVVCRGMSLRETADLTDCMLHSGSVLKPTGSGRPRVDKHSTGGLGDKVSLILAPLLACFDVEVPMLSGRGLGITGGTLDKLEAYPGFRCDLSEPEIDHQLRALGCVITGTTPQIAPADRALYRLRDVTGTVPSVPLITASILSKKLAESLDALVLDVKFGSGAFMRTEAEAVTLSDSLLATCRRLGLSASAVLSDMNQPLGQMVGNACEANEAVEVLLDRGPHDVRRLTLRLAAQTLVDVGRAVDLEQAKTLLESALNDGRAFAKYVRMIEMQGGTFSEQLPLEAAHEVPCPGSGWLAGLDGTAIGSAVIELGGGRRTKGEILNPAVGLQILSRIGQPLEAGQPVACVFGNTDTTRQESQLRSAMELLQRAIRLSESPVTPLPLLPLESNDQSD